MNPANFIGDNGIKLNIKLDNQQIFLIAAMIFISMLLAIILGNLIIINTINN